MDVWIPLIDYSSKYSVSISTLRRHIKSNKITWKLDNGKYWIIDSPQETMKLEPQSDQGEDFLILKMKTEAMEKALIKAKREIAELKTLIALYEEK